MAGRAWVQLERQSQREGPISQAEGLEAKQTMHSCIGCVLCKGVSEVEIQSAFDLLSPVAMAESST